MVVIELRYQKPLDQVEAFLEAHRNFLNTYYEQGVFLASGPKNPRDGGMIIALCSKEQAQEMIAQDPFFKEGIAEYKVIEFHPVRAHLDLKKILEV